MLVVVLVLSLAGGFQLIFRLRWLFAVAAVAIVAHATWRNWRRETAPQRLRAAAQQYAVGRLAPGEWPPPFPPPLEDVAGLVRAADLTGAGPEYVGQTLDAIRRVWGAHFAVRWESEHKALQGREAYLHAYLRTFGQSLGYADYLHLVLEARYHRGLRPEVTRAELENLMRGRSGEGSPH